MDKKYVHERGTRRMGGGGSLSTHTPLKRLDQNVGVRKHQRKRRQRLPNAVVHLESHAKGDHHQQTQARGGERERRVARSYPRNGCPVHDGLIVMSGDEGAHPPGRLQPSAPRSWTKHVHERGTLRMGGGGSLSAHTLWQCGDMIPNHRVRGCPTHHNPPSGPFLAASSR